MSQGTFKRGRALGLPVVAGMPDVARRERMLTVARALIAELEGRSPDTWSHRCPECMRTPARGMVCWECLRKALAEA